MNITTCLFTVLGGMATLGHPSETVRLNQLGLSPAGKSSCGECR